ncbi:MAG: VPLPA-CTERM sorting domain-containing protein [Rhodobacteraceae bacterium]|nr:MAG: VPLPA-CTERM sorting domain-containing protein [Paracoccaceae bacterium]
MAARVNSKTAGFFGVANADPCFDPDPGPATFGPLGDCSRTTFRDDFHPTALLHEFVANEVHAACATPIPLPAAGWLMVVAIGSLAVMRRRA